MRREEEGGQAGETPFPAAAQTVGRTSTSISGSKAAALQGSSRDRNPHSRIPVSAQPVSPGLSIGTPAAAKRTPSGIFARPESALADSGLCATSRGAQIRTGGLSDPNGARYQAAPHPERGKGTGSESRWPKARRMALHSRRGAQYAPTVTEALERRVG